MDVRITSSQRSTVYDHNDGMFGFVPAVPVYFFLALSTNLFVIVLEDPDKLLKG
jgi:adenylate kinase